ncbi:MAG: phosphoenolpyruvate carboxylase [Candidatus Rariloculaceae bacterium]
MSTPSSESVPRAEIYFPAKDKALRDDVRRLGELVGEVVRDQGGEALFDLVEAARRASIARREGDEGALQELRTLLAALTPSAARDFIRAFSTYFQMINMAEKVHRIRRRRAYLRDAKTPQPLSFVDTLTRLKDAGVDAFAIESVLSSVSVEPVFTAHPTEVTRRTLLRKQQNVARHLVDMLDPYMTPWEEQSTLGQIRMEMTTGWQTEEHPDTQIRVSDEAEHVLFFLTDVLYRMLPPFYEGLESALTTVYPEHGGRIRPPALVGFGSWVGGDMDGNPNVTAKSLRESLSRQRALVLDLYYNECVSLAKQLSQSDSRTAVDGEIRRRSELYSRHFSQAAHTVPARHRQMPYRIFLRLVAARLQATYDDDAFPYESPEEFFEDIELIADSLRANKGRNAGLFAVSRLLRRIETFGFHIATIDIRQNALVHRRVVGEGLQEENWLEQSPEQRTQRIREALYRRESPVRRLSSEGRRTLAVFQAIAHCRRKYGTRAIGPYIVSMAHGPDDVLSVLLLAKWGDLGPKGAPVPLDVVPLFETVEDLGNAASIMEGLLGDNSYREHLERRNLEQMIMVGYSDSNKDGGLASARWTLRKAQQQLVKTMAELDVKLTIFHGRGGTVSRGGGRLHEAVMAAPAGAVAGRLRMTEQGEMINAKYGLRAIAMRSLEQTVSSVLRASAEEPVTDPSEPRWQEIMSNLADASRDVYQDLIYDRPEFWTYFRDATPIDVIEQLGIGSRPAYRAENANIQDVRAIPWVFAWTQTRLLLPGWFGVGTGLRRAIELYGADEIDEMFSRWKFFQVLIADVEIVLGKTDISIAERYSELAGSLHDEIFPIIHEEYERCTEIILKLRGQKALLENDRTLRRAIRLRNPYVDPMSLLQVDLLRRWREGGRSDQAVLDALLASINGIAHGMQNTG